MSDTAINSATSFPFYSMTPAGQADAGAENIPAPVFAGSGTGGYPSVFPGDLVSGGSSSAVIHILRDFAEFLLKLVEDLTAGLQQRIDAQDAAANSTGSDAETEQVGSASNSAAASSADAAETLPSGASPIKKGSMHLQAFSDTSGAIRIVCDDGYTISCEGRDQAWSIVHKDKKATRIWGDPHVAESDGDNWDFKEQSTFIFGKNKVTVETTPAANGTTFTKAITVYNGDERVTIVDIDKNTPKILVAAADGKAHDADFADGERFKLELKTNSEIWRKQD